MQEMKIEISYEDQIYLEKICTEKGFSYSVFFKELLDIYKSSESNTYICKGQVIDQPIDTQEIVVSGVEEENIEKPKKRGRTPKEY